MQIHAMSTGTVQLRQAFLYARPGVRRQLALFSGGPWVPDQFPIHCWVVEHDGRRILVDTGEVAAVKNIPFARFKVAPDDELPGALSGVGLTVDDIDTVVLTHMHGDHMDGAVHVKRPIMVHDPDFAFTKTAMARFMQRVLKQPVPEGIDWQTYTLDDGPFGGFASSKKLTDDGRVMIVSTPGHTVGHVSVICVDDEGRHVMLAGDTTDSLEQLLARRPDAVSPKASVTVATIDRILAHGREHPTVYLPSHDPDSVARLQSGETLHAAMSS
jgi:N-acyl homoserine lactone hydrolase